MQKRILPLLFFVSAVTAMANPTTPCSSDTLADYSANLTFPASSGCAIGILNYSSFTYHPLSNAPLANSIILTPSNQGFNFTQAGNVPFVATANQTVKFEIDYNILIDPAPIITESDDSLDPPTGNVSVTEFFCNDSQYFFTGTCFGGNGIQSLTVGTIPPQQLSASIIFATPATSFQEVGIVFTLTGPASFDSLTATTVVVGAVPEPASLLLVAGFFLAAGSYKLRKRKR